MKSTLRVGLTLGLVVWVLAGCTVSLVGTDTPEPGRTSVGTLAAPSFGVVIDANMQVVSIDRGSIAEQAGVQVGDRILTMRNVTILSGKHAREIFYSENLSKPIPLVLERKGQTITLDVLPHAPLRNPNPSSPIPTVTPVPQDLYYF